MISMNLICKIHLMLTDKCVLLPFHICNGLESAFVGGVRYFVNIYYYCYYVQKYS